MASTSAGRDRTVNLATMPVIDLTQGRTPQQNGSSSSNVTGNVRRKDPNVSVNSGSSGNPANSGSGNGDEESKDKWLKVVPRPDNEPAIVVTMWGNSISCFTEIDGWSRMVPMKFFNIRESTRLHDMVDQQGQLIPDVEEIKPRCLTLAEMEDLGVAKQVTNCPVWVKVVAKRKVDVSARKDHKLLILSTVIVADDSGYCVLCSFNEGLATIYNDVDVGDQLLITRCLPQPLHKEFHRGLFSDSKFLNLEIKLQYHSVRNHYIRKCTHPNRDTFELPTSLFDASYQLKLPGDLEKEFAGTVSVPNPNTLPSSQQFYDIIGVVTHVGRIERFPMTDSAELDCIENSTTVFRIISRYVLYRWIYMVDLESKPFPVKVYIHNLTLSDQADLVPGAVLVITHCQTNECLYSGKYTVTSAYSQLYMSKQLEKYTLIHPREIHKRVSLIITRDRYKAIVQRNDINFGVGGSHTIRIQFPHKFQLFYQENVPKLFKTIDDSKPLQRRESRRLHFTGQILRVQSVSNENFPRPYYIATIKYGLEAPRKENRYYKVVENFLPYSPFRNSSWYAFKRKLPPLNDAVFNETRCRQMIKNIVDAYKPYCGPLLMPADIPNYNEDGPPPPMAELEKLDGSPYFIVDIVNEETKNWYTCIWKNGNYTIQEMKDKIDAARNNSVLCVAEVFCTETDAPLEVCLIDFITSDPQQLSKSS